MRTTAVLLTILLMLPSLALGAAPRHAAPLSARQAFALIPTEIFENTRAPLTEDERELLADQGVNAHWSNCRRQPGRPALLLRGRLSRRVPAPVPLRTRSRGGLPHRRRRRRVPFPNCGTSAPKATPRPCRCPRSLPSMTFSGPSATCRGVFPQAAPTACSTVASKCCPPSPPTACPARSTRTTPCITSGTAEPSSKK